MKPTQMVLPIQWQAGSETKTCRHSAINGKSRSNPLAIKLEDKKAIVAESQRSCQRCASAVVADARRRERCCYDLVCVKCAVKPVCTYELTLTR